jgi:hypothetical protein
VQESLVTRAVVGSAVEASASSSEVKKSYPSEQPPSSGDTPSNANASEFSSDPNCSSMEILRDAFKGLLDESRPPFSMKQEDL